ncbi:hypothetical protein SUGI_0016600 [Cryptomeria japonica]|nr:hypothetical protein SUGI_0016600 [Cryptomeria japonica]
MRFVELELELGGLQAVQEFCKFVWVDTFADAVDSSDPLAPSSVAPTPLPHSFLGDSVLVVVPQQQSVVVVL